jgi:tetratricopeptide (TPR) repeat protein
MSVFDWFTRRHAPAQPADLLDALIAAYSAKDYGAMVPLINDNSEAIRRGFGGWMKGPSEITEDPAAIARYAEMLHLIATLFERSGDRSLVEQLQAGNPLRDWNDRVAAAQALIDQGRAHEAVALLKVVLDELEADTTIKMDNYRPRILGRLGIALANAGDKREAVAVTRRALELCRALGDDEGVRAYTTNLEALGTFEMAAHDGSDANVTVVFKNEHGDTLTFEELQAAGGNVQWEVRGPQPLPAEAERLHQEGREAGAQGDYDAALSLLTRAAELAPSWAYPVYDRAFTHLLRKDFTAALSDYRRTLALSPGGFFTAETAADTLTRESEGEFPSGLYAAFAMLEHMPKDQRKEIAAQLVVQFPSFAPGWNEHVNHVNDRAERLKAIECGLAARPDRSTRGFLMIKKVVTAADVGDSTAALTVLGRLASDSTESLSTRAAAEFARLQLSSKTSG